MTNNVPKKKKDPNQYYIQKIKKDNDDDIHSDLDSQIKENFFSIQTSNLLKLVGANKTYQKKLIILIAFFNFFLAFIYYSIAYLFYVPDFLCYDKQGELSSCTSEKACSNEFGYEILAQRISIVTKYKFYCEREIEYSNALFLIFTISAFMGFFFTMMSDYFGRSFILKCNTFFFIVGTLLLVIVEDFNLVTLGLAMIFSYYDVFFSTIYILINESMGDKLRNFTLGMTFFFFGLGNFAFLAINLFVTDYYLDFIILFFVTNIGIIFYFFLKETPFFYYRTKNLKELYYSLNSIMQSNYKNEVHQEMSIKIKQKLHLTEIKLENYHTYRIKKIVDHKKTNIANFFFKLKGHWKNFISIIILFSTTSFCSAMFVVSPQYLGLDNLYINIFLLNFSEMCGYFIMSTKAKNVERKKLIQFLFIWCYISSIGLAMFTIFDIRSKLWVQICETLISMSIRFFLCMVYSVLYNYVNELFPTNIRGFCMGFCILFGRIIQGFISYVTVFCIHHNFHPLLFIGGIALFSNIFLCMLPETLRRQMAN